MKRFLWVSVRASIFFFLITALYGVPAGAVTVGYSYSTAWNPPNVLVDEEHPYYFPLSLPGWGFDKEDYTEALFSVTYLDQCLDIFIYAADPATDTSEASNYNILIGSIPYTTWGASGTETFDLLTSLDAPTFNALFKGQNMLYLVADCHYVFDKAALSLQAVPIPPAVILLGSALLGIVGIRRMRLV